MGFRFEELEIWQRSAEVFHRLTDIADRLTAQHLYRFAEQLRAAGLSTPDSIAEGSGSTSPREFGQIWNIARRSTFENASMLVLFCQRGLISRAELESLRPEFDELCRMITAFARTVSKRTPANNRQAK